MKKEHTEGQIVRRLAPVPAYDIAGTENWLSDLAEEGLFLTSEGFFADIAKFETKQPCKAKYRLEAIQHKHDEVPDSEQVEIGEKYSWEYVCKRDDFYIFRSFDSSARELNTDPEVQALALNIVKKKKRENFICALVMLFIYPIILTRGCFLFTTMAMGLPWMIAVIILSVSSVVATAKAYFHLKKVQKALIEDGYYESENNWRKSLIPYQIKRNLSLIVSIILLITATKSFFGEVSLKKTSIKEYSQALPFATIVDFAGEGSSNYQYTAEGFLDGSIDVICEKSDLLAPRYIEYNEHAKVTKADGRIINGMLYVDYAEMQSPWMAKVIAKEMYRLEKWRYFKETEKIDSLDLNVDSVICYNNIVHAPTVIMQKGNIVVKAMFHQTSSDYQIPFQDWAEIVCDSIGE